MPLPFRFFLLFQILLSLGTNNITSLSLSGGSVSFVPNRDTTLDFLTIANGASVNLTGISITVNHGFTFLGGRLLGNALSTSTFVLMPECITTFARATRFEHILQDIAFDNFGFLTISQADTECFFLDDADIENHGTFQIDSGCTMVDIGLGGNSRFNNTGIVQMLEGVNLTVMIPFDTSLGTIHGTILGEAPTQYTHFEFLSDLTILGGTLRLTVDEGYYPNASPTSQTIFRSVITSAVPLQSDTFNYDDPPWTLNPVVNLNRLDLHIVDSPTTLTADFVMAFEDRNAALPYIPFHHFPASHFNPIKTKNLQSGVKRFYSRRI